MQNNQHKKVLITGAAGMLGSSAAEYLQQQNTFDVTGTGRTLIEAHSSYHTLDLLNTVAVNALLKLVQPDVIVHCAANVNLNDCELDKEAAEKIHVDATATLALYKPGVCKFIYISTDSVFDGERGNYTEEDATEPLNNYAASKLKGEQKALALNANTAVIRTNIYGFKKNGEGNSLFEWLFKNLSAQKAVTGFTDTGFNPLYTMQLAEVIAAVATNNFTGIINAGSKEFVNKYDFAMLVAEAFDFDSTLVTKGSINALTAALKRPKNTTLCTDLLTKKLNKSFSIRDGIDCLKNDFLKHNS